MYTPLWFAVSNGYNDLVKLILNYNASPSIVDKTLKKAQFNLDISDVELLIQDDDHVGMRATISHSEPTRFSRQQQQTSYLFSPLRASIVYSRFQIMVNLCEYGANVYELFGAHFNEASLVDPRQSPASSEDFVNALKLLHRQFGPFITQSKGEHLSSNDYGKCLCKLNEFISSPNVYRRMLLEFVASICSKIKATNHHHILAGQLNLGQATSKHSLEHIIKLTEHLRSNSAVMSDSDEWSDYLFAANDFFVALDFVLSDPERSATVLGENQLSRKPRFHQSLFEFGKFLTQRFFAPKSLKELCRFKLRAALLTKIQRDKLKYSREFTKRDHQIEILKSFNLPNNLLNYLMHSI